jgi:hypothetical protein
MLDVNQLIGVASYAVLAECQLYILQHAISFSLMIPDETCGFAVSSFLRVLCSFETIVAAVFQDR